ncbi:hypothetical protein [Devosia sp.]|uniref:hypothetical protein n=1 Tax=Devosia sp. TaxID=1871048 RepID=UPI0027349F8F|nr:hypothetical protein [Devosia sp.]MDP2780181.1 hypothetical protein [Devosia sp.]
MKRLLGIAVLILALAGLSAPSLSLAAGVSSAMWSAGHSQVSATTPTKVVTCKSLGGKRVLPCHPDQGVMTSATVAGGVTSHADLRRLVALAAAAIEPEAELPPPRGA